MWWLAGCTPDRAIDATGAPSAEVPSVLVVQVPGVGDGTAFVEYGLDGFDQRTPDAGGPGASIPVLGLKAGRSYRWRAVVVDARGDEHVSDEHRFEVPDPPPGLGPLTVTGGEDAELRYVFGTVVEPNVASWAAIFDRDGDWVWWVEAGAHVAITPELGLDRRSVAWSHFAFDPYEDQGEFVRVALDGSTTTRTRLPLGHHDAAQLPDGRLAYLGIEFADLDVDGVTRRMATDRIWVGPEGMTDASEATLAFSMLDDFPLEPEPTCVHVTKLVDKLGERDVSEWSHANSLVYVEEEDAYYVTDKHTDWLFRVRASTGTVDWVMNGRGSDFRQPDGEPVWTAVDQTSLWSHAHFSDLWPGGALVFDNGDHHPGRVSRAMEISWDEAARTVDTVWSFPNPQGAWTGTLGDVRRLPADHRLITWAGLGGLDEVTADGRVVWHADTAGTLTITRLLPLDDLYEP